MIRPPKVHTPSPHPSPDAMDAAIAGRLETAKAKRAEDAARAEARAEASANMSVPKRIGRTALSTAATLVLIAGIGEIGKTGGEWIYSKVFAGPGLERKLEEPIGDVKKDLKSGDIDRDDVAVFKVAKPELAWTEASTLAGADHPTQPVVDIIQAQQGDQLIAGDHVVVPTADIEPQK